MPRQSRSPSSRLVKRERKKMVRQTVVFGGVALLIVVIFVFVVLPTFIRFFTAVFGTQTPFEPEDTLPPSPPTFSAPVNATHSALLNLEGFAEPGSELVLVVNGNQQAPVEVPDDGGFSVEANLTEGENSLSAFAVDAAGNESQSSRSYMVVFDDKPPTIEVTAPTDGETIISRANQNLEIRGITEPKSKVYVNDRIVIPSDDGSFSYSLRLNEGENNITIRAVDIAGNETEQKLTVTFEL